MSFGRDVISGVTGGESEELIGGITGSTGAAAAESAAATQAAAGREAILAQQEAAQRGQEFLAPFGQIGQQGIDQASFLTDPNQQFDFLQNNPLFNLALENANQQTQQQASASRRLSFGDTLQQLSNNVLLSAQPLVSQQSQNIRGLINVGTGIAGSQANIEQGLGAGTSGLLTDIGAAQAAGQVGSANARTAGAQNLLTLGTTALSDERLKTNKRKIGEYKGHNLYSWDWNLLAKMLFGLIGSSIGVMFGEVQKVNPSAVIVRDDGYGMVKYGEL